MEAVFTAINAGISEVIDMVGLWLEAITGSPILLFFCIALPLLTIGLSILGRIFGMRA